MTKTISTIEDLSGDNIFDMRDLIERFEELEDERENEAQGDDDAADEVCLAAWDATDDGQEYRKLYEFLEDVKGGGGDEQWRGDRYPLTFISDSYFTDYCRELVQDIGDLPSTIPGYLVIDWEATANNLRADYSSVELDGATYWYR